MMTERVLNRIRGNLNRRREKRYFLLPEFKQLFNDSKQSVGLTEENKNLIYAGKTFLENLARTRNAGLECEPGQLNLYVDGLKFNLQTKEDIYILNEIFGENAYGFQFEKNSAVVDIGMNTAVASLYFANQKNVAKVYGFEPFAPTFAQALTNLKFNPGAADKIEVFNFGISDGNRDLEVDYAKEHRSSTGVNGRNAFIWSDRPVEKMLIHLKNASEVIAPLLAAQGPNPTVLKVDCEGSEYEIFQDLSATGLLSKFSAVMVEWHVKGPELLNQHLARHGFSLLNLRNVDSPIGMIYAFRR